MLPLDWSSVTKDAITTLISNAVPEGAHLEYKEALPANSDGDKKEFLADLSAFANAG